MVLVNHAFPRNYFYSRFNTDSPTFKFGDGSRKDSTGDSIWHCRHNKYLFKGTKCTLVWKSKIIIAIFISEYTLYQYAFYACNICGSMFMSLRNFKSNENIFTYIIGNNFIPGIAFHNYLMLLAITFLQLNKKCLLLSIISYIYIYISFILSLVITY